MFEYWLGVATLTGIYMIAVLGMSILTGFTGLFSMGHAGFMAIGAYTSALLTKTFGIPIFLGVAAGMLAALLIGLLIGDLLGDLVLRLLRLGRGLGQLRAAGFAEAEAGVVLSTAIGTSHGISSCYLSVAPMEPSACPQDSCMPGCS